MSADINLNTAQCIRTAANIGYDRVHNICAGTFTDVPWGSVDWLNAAGAGFAVLLVLAVLAFLGFMFWVFAL